jgi:hypothetical protein
MSLLLERYEQMATLDRARAARCRSRVWRRFWLWLADADERAAAVLRLRRRWWVVSAPTHRTDES